MVQMWIMYKGGTWVAVIVGCLREYMRDAIDMLIIHEFGWAYMQMQKRKHIKEMVAVCTCIMPSTTTQLHIMPSNKTSLGYC